MTFGTLIRNIMHRLDVFRVLCYGLAQLFLYSIYYCQPILLGEMLASTTFEASMLLLIACTFLAIPLVNIINNGLLQRVRSVSKEVLFNFVFSQPYSFFVDLQAGAISSRINEISFACRSLEDGAVHSGLRLLAMSFVYIPFLTSLSLLYGILYLLFLILSILLAWQYAGKNRLGVSHALCETAEVNNQIIDCHHNIIAIKMFNAESQEVMRMRSALEKESHQYKKIQAKINRAALFQQAFVTLLAILIIMLMVLVPDRVPSEGSAILTLLYSVMALTNFGPQLLSMVEMTDRINAGLQGLDYLGEEGRGARILLPSAHELCIKHLSFAYGEEKVLNDASARFSKGLTALIGPNGCGKSTLLRIMAGLQNPASGDVLIPVEEESQILYIGQGDELFHRPIDENIYYPEVDSEDKKTINLINALGFFDRYGAIKAEEVDNPIDSEVELSGGQRQKVLIVRALRKNPKVLLCDEITSALDPASAQMFYELLRRELPDSIIVCSVHRESELPMFDRIINMTSIDKK